MIRIIESLGDCGYWKRVWEAMLINDVYYVHLIGHKPTSEWVARFLTTGNHDWIGRCSKWASVAQDIYALGNWLNVRPAEIGVEGGPLRSGTPKDYMLRFLEPTGGGQLRPTEIIRIVNGRVTDGLFGRLSAFLHFAAYDGQEPAHPSEVSFEEFGMVRVVDASQRGLNDGSIEMPRVALERMPQTVRMGTVITS